MPPKKIKRSSSRKKIKKLEKNEADKNKKNKKPKIEIKNGKIELQARNIIVETNSKAIK